MTIAWKEYETDADCSSWIVEVADALVREYQDAEARYERAADALQAAIAAALNRRREA